MYARKLIYGFLNLFQGMEGQVQQFVTVRFSDLWVDVSLAPPVTCVSKSWKTAAASPTQAKEEEEIASAADDGFISVLSKSAKRRMRAAAAKRLKAAAQDQLVRVHKTASSSSVPPGFAKAAHVQPPSKQAPLKF